MYELLRKFLNKVGLDIHKLKVRSGSMYYPLLKYRDEIDLVIDVGVADGTPDLYRAFPRTKKLLIEPLDTFVQRLMNKRKSLNAEVIKACASDKTGNSTFFIRNKQSTSSVNQGSSFNQKIELSTERLDIICAKYLTGNEVICLKIDTEGSEIRVLKGADKILRQCEVVVAEATLYPTLSGSNSMFELIDYMAKKGFKIQDFVNIRKAGYCFDQCDIIFVKSNESI